MKISKKKMYRWAIFLTNDGSLIPNASNLRKLYHIIFYRGDSPLHYGKYSKLIICERFQFRAIFIVSAVHFICKFPLYVNTIDVTFLGGRHQTTIKDNCFITLAWIQSKTNTTPHHHHQSHRRRRRVWWFPD